MPKTARKVNASTHPQPTEPTDDYAHAQCAVITRKGERCTGGWKTAIPIMYAWDPVKGVGIDAPAVVLCWRHSSRWWTRKKDDPRTMVVGGWLGPYNEHGYGAAVWDAPTGWTPAEWFWNRRADLVFGQRHRRDAA